MPTLFLPAIGSVVWIMGTLLFLLDHGKEVSWGPKAVWVPMLIIAGAIGLSGIPAETLGEKVAPLFTGVVLFSVYLAARVLGKAMFLPLAVGAVIASVGLLLYAALNPGVVTGGFVFEGNYDIAAGYTLLGVALLVGNRYQWLLVGLAVLALAVSGSPEAVFALGVLSVVVLLRRDWGRKLTIVIAPVLIVGVVLLATGYGQQLYAFTAHVVQNDATAPFPEQLNRPTGVTALGGRWDVIQDSMTHIKLFGEGYNLTNFSKMLNVHNVPLVIVQQLGWPGVVAGAAWLWVTLWCLFKTRWKYVWVLVLTLSVFDHYLWTQLAPWFPAIVGASLTSTIASDKLFKGNSKVEEITAGEVAWAK
jgi:hypothetical protein